MTDINDRTARKQLADKYLKGDTSIREERVLAAYYRNNPADKDESAFAAMILAGHPAPETTPEDGAEVFDTIMSLRRGKRTRILARICIPFACAAAAAAILLSVMSRHQIRTVAPDTGFSTLEVVQCLGSLIQEEFADMESLSAKPVGGNVILTVNFTDGSSQCYIMTKDGDDGISLLALGETETGN